MKIIPGNWTELKLSGAQKNNIYHLLHDMKTPLYAEQWAIKLLGDSLEHSDELAELLQSMKENNEHLLAIVHQMLETSDISTRNAVSITEVLMGVLNQLQPLAKGSDTRLQYNIKPDADRLYINKNHFRRILTNLIGNAIQHAPAGSSVSIRVRRHRTNIIIQIRDNGCGMPNNYDFGESYGLTICRTLIELCGGAIQWRSKPDPGTSVVITLPYSSPEKL